MKIQCNSTKWEKEVKKFEKLPRETYLKNNALLMDLFLNPREPNINAIRVSDKGSLYQMLAGGYQRASDMDYVLDQDYEQCHGHLYLYVEAFSEVLDLYESGHEFTNPSIVHDLERNRYTDELIYSAIAINEYELAMKHSAKIPILDCMLRGDYERAKQLVLELPTELSERERQSEVYYTRQVFLREIYLAIFDRDEKRFNEELMKRIRKYRDCPLGYATYIDAVSITLIKFARKFGLNYTFDVVEIPQYFLSDTVRADKEKYKLPI